MIKTIEVEGNNIDNAIANALITLNMDRDSISVEVITKGKSGFLGFGVQKAKIRAIYDDGQAEIKAEPKIDKQPKSSNKKDVTNPIPRINENKNQKSTDVAKSEQKRFNKLDRSDKADKSDKADTPGKFNKADNFEGIVAQKPQKPQHTPEDKAGKSRDAVEFIDGLLQRMGISGTAHICENKAPDVIEIELKGENMGIVIGRRGDTLDAIQYVTSLVINNNHFDGHYKVNLDSENYRQKRQESLERLALKTAAKVIKYKRSVTLDPMPSYERRMIHATLQNFQGVTTHSTGSEPNRRVVVTLSRSSKTSSEQ